MSESISQAQTRIAFDEGHTIVIDVEGPLDEVYSALANERRRQILSVLTRKSRPIDVEMLARQVAVQESAGPVGVSDETVRRVHISLHHHHLPKLADIGLVAYDIEESTVEGRVDALGTI